MAMLHTSTHVCDFLSDLELLTFVQTCPEGRDIEVSVPLITCQEDPISLSSNLSAHLHITTIHSKFIYLP